MHLLVPAVGRPDCVVTAGERQLSGQSSAIWSVDAQASRCLSLRRCGARRGQRGRGE